MFSSTDELVAERLNAGSNPTQENSLVRQLMRILIEGTGSGALGVEELQRDLKNLLKNAKDEDKKAFNELISFYCSTGDGGLDLTHFPYMYQDEKFNPQTGIKMHQILGVPEDDLRDKKFSICASRSAFISPALRNSSKAETFLNYMPSLFMSQCTPYLELEFMYDRKYDPAVGHKLTSAGLLKFLLGGAKIEENSSSADSAMYFSRAATAKEGTDDNSSERLHTTAGMELFTSPQTLINLDPAANANRYIPVLDPMRPFATLESATINVKGTTGVMSFKTAQVVFKVHDRSRLSEIGDLIQPATYPRTSLWLTYGWRYPSLPGAGPEDTSFGEFINNNMLIKEAYGINNSSYSFDASGQVTVTLELYTKSANELREIKLQDNTEYARIVKESQDLIERISQLSLRLRGSNQGGDGEGPKKVIAYELIDAAANGIYVDYEPAEAQRALTNLKAQFEKTKNDPVAALPPNVKSDMDQLIAALEKFFQKGTKDFSFRERRAEAADQVIKQRLDQLAEGYDPFIYFKEKHDAFLSQAGLQGAHPYADAIENYDDSIFKQKDKAALSKYKRKVVSFGKLFSVFMGRALLSIDTVEEFQVFFYNINALAGHASLTNIAEFAIDLPLFMQQYKEYILHNESTIMTVEQFIKLAVDAQFSDHVSIPYGFRKKGRNTFVPGEDDKPPQFNEKLKDEIPGIELAINRGRGAFQLPQVEFYLETLILSGQSRTSDLLPYYSSPQFNKPGSSGGLKKVLRIHIFDKGLNPFKEAANIINSGTVTTISPAPNEANSPYTRRRDTDTPSTAQAGGTITVTDADLDARTKITAQVSRMVPSLIPGMNASSIYEVSLASNRDALLASTQMMGMNKGRDVQGTPRGSTPGGLPLYVIPAKLSMRTLGCPLLSFAQMFFVDMNTGTTIDNIYGVTGITHSLTPGRFETNLDFAFYNAYGRYQPNADPVEAIKETTEALQKKNETPGPSTNSSKGKPPAPK